MARGSLGEVLQEGGVSIQPLPVFPGQKDTKLIQHQQRPVDLARLESFPQEAPGFGARPPPVQWKARALDDSQRNLGRPVGSTLSQDFPGVSRALSRAGPEILGQLREDIAIHQVEQVRLLAEGHLHAVPQGQLGLKAR